MNTCERCGKETVKLYGIDDEGLCENCFDKAIEMAELAYESWKEEQYV